MGTTKTQRGERDGRQRRALARIASAVIQPPPGKTSLKKLLPRQKKFADIWIEGLGRVSMTDAAKRAGFPESRAAVWATELTDPMKYPHVVDYIRRKQAELNERYFEKFGFIFILFATGRTAAEVRDRLEERIENDRATEIENAAREQAKITRNRIGKWILAS